MRHKGCCPNFTELRNQDLMRAYRYQIATMSHISTHELGRRIAEMPSARFWVSEERAAAVITKMLRNQPMAHPAREAGREMFREIFRRFRLLQARMPGAKIIDIVSIVVHTPAPKFYLTARTVIETIYKIKNGHYGKRH